MGWLIALAIILLILFCPIGVSARYDQQGAVVKVIAGPLRLQVFPGKKKKKEKETPPAQSQGTDNAPQEKTQGGSLTDFIPTVRLVFDFLAELRRKLLVKKLVLKVVLAGDDPCDLAVNYGRACGALASVEPQLSRFFRIRRKELDVECDFTADKTTVYAAVDLTITIIRIFSLGLRHGVKILREYARITKLRKGGATQ